MQIKRILNNGIITGELLQIQLLDTQSKIVRGNGGWVYCTVYEGLSGLFRKDICETKVFGRKLCDRIRKELKNYGFFTTDELPNYGLSREELKQIFQLTDAEAERDLVVIFAYDRDEAVETKNLLERLLLQACIFYVMGWNELK